MCLMLQAVQVADAFAELDHGHGSVYAAVMLAEAGRADEARARAHANLGAFPGDDPRLAGYIGLHRAVEAVSEPWVFEQVGQFGGDVRGWPRPLNASSFVARR